jgi:hypothetical protein
MGAIMVNGINHQLKAIKHIQNKFFNGLNVIMSSDFYQAPPLNIIGFFIPLMIV